MNDADIEQLREALKTIEQAFMEVAHAQQSGSQWYTKGESGLYQQVRMWVSKGSDAVRIASQILSQTTAR